jgi:hypothetical protein
MFRLPFAPMFTSSRGAEPWLTWKKSSTWIWRRLAPTTGNGGTDGKIELPAFYRRHAAARAREPYPTDC